MNPKVEHQRKSAELTAALETLERQSRFITDQDELIIHLRRMITIEQRTTLDPEYVRLAIARLDHAQQVTQLSHAMNPKESERIRQARNIFGDVVSSTSFPPVPSATRTETVQAEPESPPSILKMAEEVLQERRSEYGPLQKSFADVARMWTAILDTQVNPEQVALMMIAFKLCRHVGGGSRDDLVDICGYAELLDRLENEGMTRELLHSKRVSDSMSGP